MAKKKKTKTGYFTEMWFKEQTQAYQKRWDAAPWLQIFEPNSLEGFSATPRSS